MLEPLGDIAGRFSTVTLMGAPSAGMTVAYVRTEVRLVTRYANCDSSTVAPVLNVNDFVCFLNRFAAGCS